MSFTPRIVTDEDEFRPLTDREIEAFGRLRFKTRQGGKILGLTTDPDVARELNSMEFQGKGCYVRDYRTGLREWDFLFDTKRFEELMP